MAKLPSITGKKLCSLLESDGWEFVRSNSHGRIYKKKFRSQTRVTTVTNKRGPLARGTLQVILSRKQTGLGRAGLERLLNK